MIYNEMVVQDLGAVKDRCSGLPLVKVPALPQDHEAIELGAALSLLAFQVKFQDDLNDEEGFWIQNYNRFLASRLSKTFRRQQKLFQKFGIDLQIVQKEQDKLMKEMGDEIERNKPNFREKIQRASKKDREELKKFNYDSGGFKDE